MDLNYSSALVLLPDGMAPARKRGRAPSTGRPATRRRGALAGPQTTVQEPASAPPQARTASRRARSRGGAAQTDPATAGPSTRPPPQSPHTGLPQDNSALQGQITDLSEQVFQLKALLEAQASQSTSSQPVTPASPPSASTVENPAPTLLGPKDDTSPFIDAIRMLSDAGTLPSSTNQEYLSFGFSKLDSSVSIEMRNIIQGKKFINLEVLSPGRVGAVDFMFNNSLPHKISVQSSKLTKFSNFDDWFEAYLIYASVYIQKFPCEAHGILKHLSTVKRLHRMNHRWYDYDFQFRYFISTQSCSFDVYLPELIERAKERIPFASGSQPASRKSTSSSNSGPRSFLVPPGYCYSYARGNVCNRHDCPFKHECYRCGKKHPSSGCGERRPSQHHQRSEKRDSYSNKGPNTSKHTGA